MAVAKKPAAPKRAATKAAPKRPVTKAVAPKARPRNSQSSPPVELQGTGSWDTRIGSWGGHAPIGFDQYRDTRTGARTRVASGDYWGDGDHGTFQLASNSRANRVAKDKRAFAQLEAARRPKGGMGNQYEDFLQRDTVGKRNKARPVGTRGKK